MQTEVAGSPSVSLQILSKALENFLVLLGNDSGNINDYCIGFSIFNVGKQKRTNRHEGTVFQYLQM